MEFDKSKILTVVTADQAKVGSMGYLSNYIPTLEGYITGGCKPDKLVRVSLNTIYPFSDGHNYYSLFYPEPEPEPTYAERQAEWVKENGVVCGTRVTFIKNFGKNEDGSACCKNDTANGLRGTIWLIHKYYVEVYVDGEPSSWSVPFTALEVIKEPTYEERQAEWVKKHNLKEGDKIVILRTAKDREDGWDNIWNESMSSSVGSIFTYVGAYPSGISLSCGYSWPYFVLEVVKEPTYRPYNNDELNDLVGEVLTNKQSGRKKLVTGKPRASEGVNLDGSYITAKDLLAGFYRNGNEPCGVREEA